MACVRTAHYCGPRDDGARHGADDITDAPVCVSAGYAPRSSVRDLSAACEKSAMPTRSAARCRCCCPRTGRASAPATCVAVKGSTSKITVPVATPCPDAAAPCVRRRWKDRRFARSSAAPRRMDQNTKRNSLVALLSRAPFPPRVPVSLPRTRVDVPHAKAEKPGRYWLNTAARRPTSERTQPSRVLPALLSAPPSPAPPSRARTCPR